MKKLLIIPLLIAGLYAAAQKRDTIVAGNRLTIVDTLHRGKIVYYRCYDSIRKTTSPILKYKP